MDPKPGFRFSLKSLIGLVTVVAVCCAALVYASPWTARGACLATIILLMFSILAAFEAKPFDRVFWRGFAICAWAYFLITLAPQHQVWTLPITSTLADLAEGVQGTPTMIEDLQGEELRAWRIQRQTFSNSFIEIGHACFLLLFGFLGGVVAQLMRLRNDRDT